MPIIGRRTKTTVHSIHPLIKGRRFRQNVQHSTSVSECPAVKPNPTLTLFERLAKNFYLKQNINLKRNSLNRHRIGHLRDVLRSRSRGYSTIINDDDNNCRSLKAAFHDTDIDTGILARILARKSRVSDVSARISRGCRRRCRCRGMRP